VVEYLIGFSEQTTLQPGRQAGGPDPDHRDVIKAAQGSDEGLDGHQLHQARPDRDREAGLDDQHEARGGSQEPDMV
jgi:hypothetical protein